MARTHVRPRDVMGRRLVSFFGHVTGVHPRHPGGLTHPPCTGVFPFIFVINKDAVVFAVASFGPYGARNNNETATRLTTRMSETSVLITWGRRDLETPHLRPRQRQGVVNTLSRGSRPYESGNLDLQIANPRFTNPAGFDVEDSWVEKTAETGPLQAARVMTQKRNHKPLRTVPSASVSCQAHY